jgi:tetratricopeptide (TPR) repeat protein
VAGDLETVIQKAMRKDASRRYATAEQFASDLDAYLEGRAVTARPDTAWYRVSKFARRHAVAVAAAAITLLSLVGAVVYSGMQARRAEKRFQQVRLLANRFLFDFHDSIKNLSGSLAAREMMARTGLEYLDSLAADARGDDALTRELAAAYEKVGDVWGDRYGPNLGKAEEALASWEKARALRLQVAGETPTAAGDVAGLVSATYKVSDGLTSTGNTQQGLEMLRRGLALAESRGAARDRIPGYTREGDLLLRQGDLAAARASYGRAAASAEQIDSQGRTAATRRMLSAALSRQAHAEKLRSRDEEALRLYARVVTLDEEALREEPGNPFAARSLLSAYYSQGDILRSPFTRRGKMLERSLEEYGKAKEIADQLLRADPRNFTARFDALFARMQIADTWRELEPRRGVNELAGCLRDLDALVRENPSFKDYERMASLLRFALADAQIRAGERAAAEKLLSEVVPVYRRLLDNDPARAQMRRELLIAYAERGWLRRQRGERAEAMADAAACVALADTIPLAKARPMDLRDGSRCHELAAEMEMMQGNREQARGHLNRARELWRQYDKLELASEFITQRRREVEKRLAEVNR